MMKDIRGTIALAFAGRIQAALSEEDFSELVELNRTPEYAVACASHNYLDANDVMARAAEQSGASRGAR